MKKQMQVIVTFLLILSSVMTSVLSGDYINVKAETNDVRVEINESEESEKENAYEEEDVEKDVEISYKITGQWDKHYNLEVTLTNLTDEKIDDWEIRVPVNFEIENIWNARITEEQDGEYMIHNAEWNQDIPHEGSISFGMTIMGEEEPVLPQYCEMVRMCLGVTDDYDVSYTEYSRWDNHVNGKLTITNNTERTIEDWSLLLESNIEIENIWNASIVDSYELRDGESDGFCYSLENVVNNQNIKAGEAVEFGFIAKSSDKVEIFESQLFELIEDDDEVDYDYEEEEDYDYDELIWDEDAFETSEEYVEYINRIDGVTEKSDTYKLRRSAANGLIDQLTPIVGTKYDTIYFGEDADPIQNYLPVGNEIYTLHHSLDDERDAYLMKRKEDNTFSDRSNMTGFAHGQTFEQVKYKGNEYYLLAGKASGEFSKNIVFMRRNKFEELFSTKLLNFNDWNKDKSLFTYLYNLEYSNEKSEKLGKLTRTDAALTADGKVLVIWKQLFNKKENSYFNEISFYDMNKVNKFLFKKNKKTMKARINFKGKYRSNLAKACIGSIREKYKRRTDNSKRILQPEGSFQAIDVEWVKDNENRLQVYITSGNENKDLNPHAKASRKKNLTVMYLDCVLSKGKLKKCTAYRSLVTCNKNGMGDTIKPESTLEIEGCHVMGDSLHYVITPSGKVKKGTQFIYYIPVSSFKEEKNKEKELKIGKTN